MSSYEWAVSWPHTGANHVVVTGTFDNWSLSRVLRKNPSGTFETVVEVPYGQKVLYKFMVDGRWTTVDNSPTELDTIGNLNNVFLAPPPPANVEKPKAEPISATDVASTIIAREGVSNPLAYVASGIGAAIKAVVGVDPVNGDKISIQTPKVEAAPPLPPATVPQSAKAPIVPIDIIPVNVPPESPPVEPKVNGHAVEASTHTPTAPATFNIEEPKSEAPVPVPAPEPTPAAPIPEPEPTPAVPEPTRAPEPEPVHTPEPAQAKVEPSPQPEVVAKETIPSPSGTNGTSPRPVTPPPAPLESASAPVTPAKKHLFSKSSTDSPSKHSRKGSVDTPSSPGKSSFDSSSHRSGSLHVSSGSAKKKKKRNSFIGKVKEFFHHHHDKEGSK